MFIPWSDDDKMRHLLFEQARVRKLFARVRRLILLNLGSSFYTTEKYLTYNLQYA